MKQICLFLFCLLLSLYKGFAIDDKDEKELTEEFYANNEKASIITNGNESLKYSLKALEIAKKLNNERFIARSYNQIGYDYEQLGDFKSALSYTLAAMRIYERIGDQEYMGDIYNHIGTIYSKQGNKRLAINYMEKAINIHKKLNAVISLATDFVNIGEVYRSSKKYDLAIEYFQKTNDIYSKDSGSKFSAYVAGNIGLVYAAQNKMYLANKYISKATEILEKLEDYYPITVYLRETSEIYFKNGKIDEALNRANEALRLSIKENLREQIRDTYKLLTDIYSYKGDFKNAYIALNEYNILKDSIVNSKVIGDMAEMRTDYEVSKRETEINNLKEINTLRNRVNIILSISVVLVVMLMLFLFKFNKNLKNANLQLSSQKQELEVKNEIIHNSLQEKETLLKEIHHRVKNNLQIISSLLSLQSQTVKNKKVLQAFQESQQRLHSISLIHQKLYQNETLSSISMQEYFDDLVGAIHYAFTSKNENINYTLDAGNINLDIDTAVPLGLIVNELATNAYKYAFSNVKDGVLQISLSSMDDQQYKLVVRDNGPGLPENLNIMESQSLGLRLVTILSRQLHGELKLKSEKGAEFCLIFADII